MQDTDETFTEIFSASTRAVYSIQDNVSKIPCEVICHEMNGSGRHRLVVGNPDNELTDPIYGQSSMYQHVASITYDGKLFIAVTDYYSGYLPTNQPLQVMCGTMISLRADIDSAAPSQLL